MKHSSPNNDETFIEEDFIDGLPDALLTQKILSLIPDADACRTSVLSKRWKDLWMFLPNLHVVIPSCEQEAKEYYDKVDKILAIRDGMPIQRFFLHCRALKCDLKRVLDWIRIAVLCGVQSFVFKFSLNRGRPYMLYHSFWHLFKTCNTLVELTLEDIDFEVFVPEDDKVIFPFLKKLSLVGVQCLCYDLTNGCPVLEELCFTRHDDNMRLIHVSSTSLKRFRMYASCASNSYKCCLVVINAPNLEYLYIMDELETQYSFRVKPLSLVEAYIDTNFPYADEIVTNISAAKVLTLINFTTIRAVNLVFHQYELDDDVDEFDDVEEVDEVNDSNVQIFPNLVKLVIGIPRILDWRFVGDLLHNMPKLDHIAYLNEHPSSCMGWNPPLHSPPCPHFCTMEGSVLLDLGSLTQEEIAFTNFMFKKSSNLKKFSINVLENDHDSWVSD